MNRFLFQCGASYNKVNYRCVTISGGGNLKLSSMYAEVDFLIVSLGDCYSPTRTHYAPTITIPSVYLHIHSYLHEAVLLSEAKSEKSTVTGVLDPTGGTL